MILLSVLLLPLQPEYNLFIFIRVYSLYLLKTDSVLSVFPESFSVASENQTEKYFPQHNKPYSYSFMLHMIIPNDTSLLVLSYW